jgi:low temperature requirement protein LtrA
MTSPESFRVSTLELFFDLVFVFTFIQLSESLAHELTPLRFAESILILAVVWWMYSGYAWLTNAVAPSSSTRRTLLLTGMGGFLVLALAIPEAFGADGRLFGVSYLVVTLVHAVLFTLARPESARAMRPVSALNIGGALLVLAGGLVEAPYRHLLLLAAVLVQFAVGHLRRLGGHDIAAGHFVERHALVVIVALGESIISIGLGFRGLHLTAGSVLVAVLGLGITYYLWWCYFSGDDRHSEHVLARCEPPRQARLALYAWGFAHFPLLLGIVLLAAGVKESVGHAFEALHYGQAIALGGGAALYLFGHALFLRTLGLPGLSYRVAAGLGVLATIPLSQVTAVAQLGAILAVLIAAAISEDLPGIRRAGSTAISDFGRTPG